MFNKTTNEAVAAASAKITTLTAEVAALKGEIAALTEQRDSTQDVIDLQKRVEELTIQKDRMEEDNARKVREVEHDTGLLRKQLAQEKVKQEQDLEHAKRLAQVEVREENLAKDQKRFKDEMDFQQKALAAQLEDGKKLVDKLLESLPEWKGTVALTSPGTPAAISAKK